MTGAGAFNRRVSLERSTPTDDPKWGPTDNWAAYATPWAAITPMGGSERFIDQAVQSEVTHAIRIRYRSDVTSKDRIVYGGRTFDIVSAVDVGEQHEELLIAAKEHPQTP